MHTNDRVIFWYWVCLKIARWRILFCNFKSISSLVLHADSVQVRIWRNYHFKSSHLMIFHVERLKRSWVFWVCIEDRRLYSFFEDELDSDQTLRDISECFDWCEFERLFKFQPLEIIDCRPPELFISLVLNSKTLKILHRKFGDFKRGSLYFKTFKQSLNERLLNSSIV